MKKTSILFVTALAGLAALSCAKESNTGEPRDSVIHFRAVADEPGVKTAVLGDESNVKWLSTDHLYILETLSYATAEAENNTSTNTGSAAVYELTNDDKTATFNASISAGTPDGMTLLKEASYVAAYPLGSALSQGGKDSNKFWRVKMPDTQWPGGASFDPAADILLSAPVQKGDKSRVTVGDELSFRFHRIGTAVKMTVKGLENGEHLKQVVVTAPVNIAGYAKVDLSNGGYLAGAEIPYDSKSQSIVLKFNDLAISGDVDVWFRVLPGTWSGTLEVMAETDAAYYYRTTAQETAITLSTPMVFADGGRTRFSVGLGTKRVEKDPATELAEGNYLILAKNDTYYYALRALNASTEAKSRMTSVAYTGSLVSFNGDADLVWNVTKSGSQYLFANDGKYLGYKGGENTAFLLEADESWTGTNYLLDIDWDGTNSCYHATVHGTSRKLGRNSGNDWFAFYESAQQQDLIFVPATADARAAVTLSFDNATVDLTTANFDTFIGQDVVADPSVPAITEHIGWSYSGDTNGVIDDFDAGVVELSGNIGSVTITARFDGDEDYRPAEASYTINVTDGNIDYSALGTSNVTLSTDGGTSASAAKVKKYGEEGEGVNALKAGTGSAAGAVKITVPSGTTNLHLHAAGWKDDTVVVGITGATASPAALSLTADEGISNNSPFTLSEGSSFADFYFNIELSGIDSDTELTFTATSGKRFVIWGVNAVSDPREDPGMGWSAASATATYNNGNSLSFSAPELTAGSATGITYASTDETIATINGSGEVSITALSGNTVKEGSTTIKAIFAGDATYRPQTVSYTLTVADGRDAVATPTFDTDAGAVAANTVVSFQCATAEVTYHYTVDGSTPTLESPTGSSVTIDATKTVKVLAAKTGYKPSAVASATYSISGSYDFETIAELNALAGDSAAKSGYLTGAVVSFVPASNTAIVKDGTGSIMFYNKSGHGLLQGQTYTGEITVTLVKYNSLYSEVTAWDASFEGEQTTVDPESVALSALIGHYDDYQNAYVQVAGLTVTAIDGTNNKNVHVTDGANTYVVYYNPGNPSCAVGDVITAVGTITKYEETEELKVWKAADLIVTATTPKAVTFTQPTGAAATAGCSFTVSVGGTPITSGDTVASGTTVTLTATAGTDYEFTSWTVTGASVASASASTTTFTMGTSPVSISATFTSTASGGPSTSTYTFTSKAWADSQNAWTSGKDGNQLTSGRGIQVTAGASGANATTKSSFSGVSEVVVTYSTNAKNGAGSVAIKVGTNDAHSQVVTITGGTTDRTLTFPISPSESGTVNITVTCSTNSIYIKSVAITHN